MRAVLRLGHFACLCAAVFAVRIVAADSTKNLGFLGRFHDVPHGGEAGHFVLFEALSWIVNLSVFEARAQLRTTRTAVLCGTIVAALIGPEELSRTWIASRQAILADLAASYAGVAIFA